MQARTAVRRARSITGTKRWPMPRCSASARLSIPGVSGGSRRPELLILTGPRRLHLPYEIAPALLSNSYATPRYFRSRRKRAIHFAVRDQQQEKIMEKVDEPPSCTSNLVLIGRNSRGNWVAQESHGLFGGLFVSRAQAVKYALSENGHHPATIVADRRHRRTRHASQGIVRPAGDDGCQLPPEPRRVGVGRCRIAARFQMASAKIENERDDLQQRTGFGDVACTRGIRVRGRAVSATGARCAQRNHPGGVHRPQPRWLLGGAGCRRKIGGLFWRKQAALDFAKTNTAPGGYAIVFPQAQFELDMQNHGNPLLISSGGRDTSAHAPSAAADRGRPKKHLASYRSHDTADTLS